VKCDNKCDVYRRQTAQLIATSERSAASQTHDCGSQSRHHPVSSVPSDPKSLPPPSLASYPVYRPTNIRVNSTVDDKWRPLSYRWLIRHCAEHIHVKPDVIERFVERLELLHIVPKNPHDSRERLIRSGLIRRCFKSASREHSTVAADRTQIRCRRRLPSSFPPRKLL